jgi:AraC family transcriptional regulator, transcriptional activator of pobA
VVPARHVHGFRFTPDIDGPVVTAAQQPLESMAAAAAPDLLPQLRRPAVLDVALALRHGDALMPLFDAIEREARMQAAGQLAAGAALLVALFVQVARIAASQGAAGAGGGRSRQAAQVERFRALVDARFRERLPIEAYAQALGLSAGQLTRLCQAALGQSSLAVVNARVLHEAQRELVYSSIGIQQIAALLGFADEAYFGRFFRKHTGHTPSEFRRLARARLAPAQPGTATASGRGATTGGRSSAAN